MRASSPLSAQKGARCSHYNCLLQKPLGRIITRGGQREEGTYAEGKNLIPSAFIVEVHRSFVDGNRPHKLLPKFIYEKQKKRFFSVICVAQRKKASLSNRIYLFMGNHRCPLPPA